MKNICSISLKMVIAFLVIFLGFQGIQVNAFWDFTPPTISNIQVDNNSVYTGDTVTGTIKAIDNESTITEVVIWYYDGKGFLKTFDVPYDQQTKQVLFKIPITPSSNLGEWKITKIWFYYESGTFNILDSSDVDLSGGTFEVLVKPDTEKPIFKGITIDKREVTLGNPVKVSISAEDIDSGIEVVKVSYLTPTGEDLTLTTSYNWFKDSYEAIVPVSDFSSIGDWKVASVYLKDRKGNEITIANSSIEFSGIGEDLNLGNFQAIEDSGDTSESFEGTKFYATDITFSNETINGDVYIGPDAVITINGNVTINGDLHIFGSYMLDGSLQVKGTLNLTKNLDYVPIYLNNHPLTAVNNNINISGKTLPFVSMYIEDQSVPINSDGTFVLNNLNVQDKQGITVKFIDLSGSEIVRQFSVKHETKPAPPAPIVNVVLDNVNVVTGSAEAGSKIDINVDDVIIGSAYVGENSQFSVPIPMQTSGTKLVISATDHFNNISESTTMVVKDGTPPAKPKVNQVSDKDTTLSGTAEANSTVYVKSGSTILGYAKADSAGTYRVNIAQQKPGTNLLVYAMDVAKNKSATVSIKVADKSAPTKPSVKSVSDKDIAVTGTAEANSTVYVYNGSTTLGYAKVDSNGAYRVNIVQQKPGTNLLVYAMDVAKNKSATVSIKVADKSAPTKPSVKSVSDKDIVVTGTAEANSTVYVKTGSTTLGYAQADSAGVYRVNIAQQKPGTNLLIYAMDAEKNKSTTVSIKVADKTAPVKPSVKSVSDKDIVVTGTAEANSTVYVKNGSTTLGYAKADSAGVYRVNIAQQKPGTNLLLYAMDAEKNKSATVSIKVADKTAPVKPSVKSVSDKDRVVTGTAEAYSTVYVKNGSTTLGYAKVNNSGAYSVNIAQQKSGTNLLVYAMDGAKNKSTTVSIKVVDKTAPAKPSVKSLSDKDTVITGTAEAYSTVYVYNGKTLLGQAVVDKTGNYKVNKVKFKKGAILTVYVKDTAGNKSDIRTIQVK